MKKNNAKPKETFQKQWEAFQTTKTLPTEPIGDAFYSDIRKYVVNRELLRKRQNEFIQHSAKTNIGYKHLLHDLRSPALALAHLQNIPSSPGKPSLQKVTQAATEDLVHQIQDAQQILEFKKEPMHLKDLTQTLRSICNKYQSIQSSISFKVIIPHLHIFIRYSPTQIQRAVENLISNALEFAQSYVEVSLTQNKGMIRIEVRNDVSGLPKNHTKSNHGNRPAYGLLSAKYIMHLHGGRLSKSHTENETIVTLTLKEHV